MRGPEFNAGGRRRLYGWLVGGGAWFLVVLFSSSRISAADAATSWPDALKIAAGQWAVWLIAAALIIRLDKLFPVSREALLPRLVLHIPSSLVVSGLTTYVTVLVVQFLSSGSVHLPDLPAVLRESWKSAFYTHVMIYWAIVGVYISYDYQRRLNERQIRSAQLERLVAQSQLQALRTQLHPHFLFNSLNAISAHVERNPRTARLMLDQLGELLRLSLEHSGDHEIPLEKEIAFIRHYLDLQEIRYEERLEVKINVDARLMDALVPTFVLQPLVENSIRRGISTRSEKGRIDVMAWQSGGQLWLLVEDDGTGLLPGWDLERDSGVGISNTRERLRWLYGQEHHTFSIAPCPNGRGVRLTLSFPLHYSDPLIGSSVSKRDQHLRVSS